MKKVFYKIISAMIVCCAFFTLSSVRAEVPQTLPFTFKAEEKVLKDKSLRY